jgi:hypothetical protein
MVYKKEVYLQMFKTMIYKEEEYSKMFKTFSNSVEMTITEAVEMTLYKNAVKKIRAAKQAMKK